MDLLDINTKLLRAFYVMVAREKRTYILAFEIRMIFVLFLARSVF